MRWNIYFSTDYDHFLELIAQSRAFQHANELDFAVQTWNRGMTLFRGKPFKRMYDQWSERMRNMILNRLDSEIEHFQQETAPYVDAMAYQKTLRRISAVRQRT